MSSRARATLVAPAFPFACRRVLWRNAGVLRAGVAGVVTVAILPGRDRYEPSTRNGVTTLAWNSYHGGSFTFVTEADR